MADDEETPGEEFVDPTFATAGPRRSTFTPPPASSGELHDDDELAAALAEDFSRVGSGTLSVPPAQLPAEDLVFLADAPPPTTPAVSLPEPTANPDDEGDDDALESVESAHPITFPTPTPSPLFPGDPSAFAANTPSFTVPAASSGNAVAEQPWSALPAPDPTHAVPVQTSAAAEDVAAFGAPQRRSLTDTDLMNLVDSEHSAGNVLGAIDRLEEQLTLRASEAREFEEWERTIIADASPQAVAVLQDARERFREVLTNPTTSTGTLLLPFLPASTFAPSPLVPAALGEPRTADADPGTGTVAQDAAEPEQVSSVTEPELLPSGETADHAEHAEQSAEHEPAAVDATEPEVTMVAATEPEAAPLEAEPEVVAGELLAHDPDPENVDDDIPDLVEPPRSGPIFPPTFDDLLAGDEQRPQPQPQPQNDFIPLHPVASGEPVPTDTGSVYVQVAAPDADVEDDVDESDRADPFADLGLSTPTVGGPVSSSRLAPNETVLMDPPARHPGVFSVELSGEDPTPADRRAGRASRMFWMWFAANSSIISIAVGAIVLGLGVSLRQAVVGILAGIALSALPLGLTTLASKRSGQPTMVVSRATFGLLGNIGPAVLAIIARAFWGSVIVWLVGTSVVGVLSPDAPSTGLALAGAAVVTVVAALIAFVGYGLIARVQLVLTIVSAVFVLGFIAATAGSIDIATVLTVSDGSWMLSITAAIIVFSFVGLAWAFGGGDLARYQGTGTSGGVTALWSSIGATLPALGLMVYGALLAASDEAFASGLTTAPLATITDLVPSGFAIPLMIAVTVSLLSGLVITLYSGGFALQSAGVRLSRPVSVIVVAIIVLAIAALLVLIIPSGTVGIFRDVATTLAVPTAAWTGLFAAELMLRRRPFDGDALLRPGGAYPMVRWVNLGGLIVISIIGWGFTTAALAPLAWQGYLFALFGVTADSPLGGTDLGVIIALVLGLLVPLTVGRAAVREQDADSPRTPL